MLKIFKRINQIKERIRNIRIIENLILNKDHQIFILVTEIFHQINFRQRIKIKILYKNIIKF
jgi:hypothetical protein